MEVAQTKFGASGAILGALPALSFGASTQRRRPFLAAVVGDRWNRGPYETVGKHQRTPTGNGNTGSMANGTKVGVIV